MTDIKITNYKDLRLRTPRADWRIGRGERWIADLFGLPADAVHLVLPDGRDARSDKTLGSLRKDWGT
jgi:hypothetical protein